jgi:hypothetical protein
MASNKNIDTSPLPLTPPGEEVLGINTKRPRAGPPSQRQLSKQLGISRAKLWRATKVAEIPEDEFEALIESENPPTVSALVELGRGKSMPTAVIGLRNLQRAWNRAIRPPSWSGFRAPPHAHAPEKKFLSKNPGRIQPRGRRAS